MIFVRMPFYIIVKVVPLGIVSVAPEHIVNGPVYSTVEFSGKSTLPSRQLVILNPFTYIDAPPLPGGDILCSRT